MKTIQLSGLSECTGVHASLGELFECPVCTVLFNDDEEN